MTQTKSAILERFPPAEKESEGNSVGLLPAYLPTEAPKEDPVIAGYGACYACKKEGHPERCGGFVNDGKGYGNCKTCGHNFNQHA